MLPELDASLFYRTSSCERVAIRAAFQDRSIAMASARSQVRKRSIVLRGHKTSISLEDAFWEAARDIAVRKGISVGGLIEMINVSRNAHNLSSAIRVFVLEDRIKTNRERTERR